MGWKSTPRLLITYSVLWLIFEETFITVMYDFVMVALRTRVREGTGSCNGVRARFSQSVYRSIKKEGSHGEALDIKSA